MCSISYYVSDHGYGHAARSIALIRYMLNKDKKLKIFINTSKPLGFIKNSLRKYSDRVIYREIKNDIGLILKLNSLNPDYERINKEVKALVSLWDDYITKEISFYESNPIKLIISDITPQAFIIANKLGIPSIGISNFTWYSMYKNKLDSEIVNVFKKAYSNCDYFFSLEFESDELTFKKKLKYGVFSRKIDKEEVKRIKAVVPNGSKIIYLALGKSVDLNLLRKFNIQNNNKIYYLVSEGSDLRGDNIIRIPSEYTETQNYTAACDLVIAKAGWGTISECIIGKVPFLIIERNEVNEDKNTINILRKKYKGFYKIISQKDLYNLNIDNVINDELNIMKEAYRNYKFDNDYEISNIVNSVFEVLYKQRSDKGE